jgi:hypothetical protein
VSPVAAATPERQLLASAFRRRGMRDHLRALARREWTEDLVLAWLRYLKVPPHQDDYPIHPRGAPCPRCGSKSANRTATGTMLVVSFPGRLAERCMGCRAVWVHEERY